MRCLVLLLVFLAAPAHSQTLDETMLFLITPGYYEQVLKAGVPYTLKQEPFPPYRPSELNITIKIAGKCNAEILYDEIEGKEVTHSEMHLDFAKASVLDLSGSDYPGVVIKGVEGLFCRKDRDYPEICTDDFQVYVFNADIFSKDDRQQLRPDVKTRYERAFAYYRANFCKGRAF